MLNLKIATNQSQRSDFKSLQQMQWVMAENNIKIKLEGICHENFVFYCTEAQQGHAILPLSASLL